MKKGILFLAACVSSAGLACAQPDNDFLQFFPNREGARMVNKTYDANDNLLSTTTMTVQKYYEYVDGSDIQIAFVMMDAAGNTVDQGTVDARYEDGDFYLKMGDRSIDGRILNYLSMENELMGDFLDYPNPMGSNDMMDFDPVFAMDAGNYTIRSKSDKKEFVRVSNHSREYAGAERVSTPAGTFDASKIIYQVDVDCEGETKHYRGVEWYAPGAGIVRSEIYDGNNLQNYTVLTMLNK